ncbi:MAG: hypothetical protein IPJ20_11015 [Flammeovirgaceae bacterium]|nr:hypothetical protein [Flammeovirgaceae bacterium]
MRKIFGAVVVVAFGIGFIHLSGCGGDPEPDPCLSRKQTKAGFKIGEIPNFATDTLLISDTVLTNNLIVFRADSNYLSYEWKIGDDDRIFNQSEVKLIFQYPESITIRLIARWTPDLNCFPKDDGIDTVYRILTVIDYYENPIVGVFTGYVNSNPNHSFNVSIAQENISDPECDCTIDPQYCDCTYLIRNVNEGCEPFRNGTRELRIAVGYKHLKFSWEEGLCNGHIPLCRAPIGWVKIDETGKNAIIKFSTLLSASDCNQPGDKRIKDTFYGKKAN